MADQVKYLFKLRDKHVLVFGGSSGIGYAVAEAATEHGARVTISSSDPDRVTRALDAIVAAYPSRRDYVNGRPCDLGDESTMDENIRTLFEELDPVDHVVFTGEFGLRKSADGKGVVELSVSATAPIGESVPPVPIANATVEDLRTAMGARYIAPALVAKHAGRHLRPDPATSITLSTGVVTERPIPGWSAIAGARSAIIGLGKNLALDLRPVRVNIVAVGAVDTGVSVHQDGERRVDVQSALESRTAMGRVALAEDVAEAYLYCMKDMNVTGSVISTNGGVLLR
nr:hypothetical protein B0A51_00868 [Rachicladosporium sp. CCFEE 5018]